MIIHIIPNFIIKKVDTFVDFHGKYIYDLFVSCNHKGVVEVLEKIQLVNLTIIGRFSQFIQFS